MGCLTEKELKEWRDSQLKQIKTYVPENYRPKAEAEVEAKFNGNLARIRNEEQSEQGVEKEPAESEVERAAKKPTEPEMVVEKKPTEETERIELSENVVASTDLIAKQVAAPNLILAVPLVGVGVLAACAVVAFVVRRGNLHAEPEGYLNLAEP